MTRFTSGTHDCLCFANSRTQAVFAVGLLQHECSSLIQTVRLSSKVSILCFEPLHCSLANFSNVVPLKLRERLMLHTIEVSVLLLHKLQHGEESQQPKALSCTPEYLQ